MCRIAAFQAAQGDDRAFFSEIQSLKSLSGFSVVRETSDCALSRFRLANQRIGFHSPTGPSQTSPRSTKPCMTPSSISTASARQRTAGKSSLRGERKMHPPQASGKRREIDPLEIKCVCNIKHLIRGGERWIQTRDTVFRTA